MIAQRWVNETSLSEVCVAGDTTDVRGETPHAAGTTAPKCGEQHLTLKRHLPVLCTAEGRLLSKHRRRKNPDSTYLMEPQVLNRNVM